MGRRVVAPCERCTAADRPLGRVAMFWHDVRCWGWATAWANQRHWNDPALG